MIVPNYSVLAFYSNMLFPTLLPYPDSECLSYRCLSSCLPCLLLSYVIHPYLFFDLFLFLFCLSVSSFSSFLSMPSIKKNWKPIIGFPGLSEFYFLYFFISWQPSSWRWFSWLSRSYASLSFPAVLLLPVLFPIPGQSKCARSTRRQ